MKKFVFDDRKEQAGDFLVGLGIGRNDLTTQERERAIKQIDDGLVSWKTPIKIQIKDIELIVKDVPDELAHLRQALA